MLKREKIQINCSRAVLMMIIDHHTWHFTIMLYVYTNEKPNWETKRIIYTCMQTILTTNDIFLRFKQKKAHNLCHIAYIVCYIVAVVVASYTFSQFIEWIIIKVITIMERRKEWCWCCIFNVTTDCTISVSFLVVRR